MNIESVNTASPPTRTSSAEVGRQPQRSSGMPPKATAAVQQPSTEISVQDRQPPSNRDLNEAVERLAAFVSPSQSEISFSIDEDSGVRVVKILDSQSKEVIRQIPSEEAVELARALDKLQGLLIKDSA